MSNYAHNLHILHILRATLRELAEHDPGAEYASFMGLDVLRAALWRYRGIISPTLCQLLGKADDYLVRRLALDPLPQEQADCIADPARASEAADMLDDMVARCGLSQDLADALLEAIADSYHVNARG